jgi:SAM-dependent methyltransferase
VRYVTQDWGQSPHPGARSADIVGSADALPVVDGSFDLVLCTQVLEHVPRPQAVLEECFRVLVSGGRIALTVPLMWELHELPHDYFRYTHQGVRHLLTEVGFIEPVVEPRSDGFTTIAQLLRNMRWAMGDAEDGLASERGQVRDALDVLADQIARLAPLDTQRIMPLGYNATARKP